MALLHKSKRHKKYAIKLNIKFKDYKNRNEANRLENQINCFKNNTNADKHKEYHKEFIKSNRLILKSQQMFNSEIQNVFPEEVNKIIFSGNNDKWIQSVDCKQTYVYGKSEDKMHTSEGIENNNIIKQYKNE